MWDVSGRAEGGRDGNAREQDLHFSAVACKDKFVKNPKQYLGGKKN